MRIIFTAIALSLLMAPSGLLAESHTKISAAMDVSTLESGRQAWLAVVLDIPKDFHAQSHTPPDPYAIKCELTLDKIPGIEFGEIGYPKGTEEEFPALGKLNVYTGTVIIRVPITVTNDAPAGPIKLSGSVQIQVCNGETCLAPEEDSFTVETAVSGVGTPVESINKTLFQNQSTTQPASSPSK